jgi:hypothetical protein
VEIKDTDSVGADVGTVDDVGLKLVVGILDG